MARTCGADFSIRRSQPGAKPGEGHRCQPRRCGSRLAARAEAAAGLPVFSHVPPPSGHAWSSPGAVLPRGAVRDRVNGFSVRFPGARVDITTNVDEPLAWLIVGGEGNWILEVLTSWSGRPAPAPEDRDVLQSPRRLGSRQERGRSLPRCLTEQRSEDLSHPILAFHRMPKGERDGSRSSCGDPAGAW